LSLALPLRLLLALLLRLLLGLALLLRLALLLGGLLLGLSLLLRLRLGLALRRVPGAAAPRRDEGRRDCSRCMRRSTGSTAQPAWRSWPFTSSAYGIVPTVAPIE